MGSKSSNAPAPDPRLVDAQIESMGVQNAAIQQMLSNTESLAPLQRQQLQFGLDAARTAYDQGQQDRQYALDMRGRYTSAIEPILQDARSFNQSDRETQLRGMVSADVSQAFDAARGQQTRELTRLGINPNSGRFASFNNQMGSDEALAKVMANRKVAEAARAEGLNLRANAANLLSGFPAQAAGLGASGAGLGLSGLNTVNAGLTGLNSGYGAASTAANQWGNNATSMWNAQANYKSQQDQIAASSDPFSTILGAAAGIGTRWALGKWA